MSWPWPVPEVGVYFDMSFEDYLAIPCLNASGIKELNISETDFWSRSFMNPHNDDIDDDTRAKIEGRAYHKRILEGKDAFYAQYALEYEDDGDPNILRTADDMKAALTSMGIKGLSGKKVDYLDSLCQQYVPQYNTLYRLKKEHSDAAGGREMITPKLMRYIEFMAKMVELHPDTRDYFINGYPEVTVIFTIDGCVFKARFDYLTIFFPADLKTFANQFRAKLPIAVRKAFANQKYHIQGALYLTALQHAKVLVSMGKVFGNADKEFLREFVKTPVNDLKYCFVQKGIAPAVVPLSFNIQEKAFEQGMTVIKDGISTFKESYAKYGEGYWVTSLKEEMLSFDELPNWANDL